VEREDDRAVERPHEVEKIRAAFAAEKAVFVLDIDDVGAGSIGEERGIVV